MSKIVKYNEFKNVIDALWEKSKEAFSYFEDAFRYLDEDKASLNKDNVFSGKNTFNEVMLTGKTVFTKTEIGPDSDPYVLDRYCGYRRVSTHVNSPTSNKQYVSNIKIRVLDNLNVGDVVTGIHIVEIEKKATKQQDIVGKKITDGGSFVVEADDEFPRCIYVPVEKEYDKDTYFLIGQVGIQQLRQNRFDVFPNFEPDSINGLYITQLPDEGQELAHDRGVGWVVIHALTTNTINVREELKSTNSNINNKVDRSEVGNGVGQIPKVEDTGRLSSSIMPNLAITDVIIIQDLSDIMAQNVQVGDVIVVENMGNKTYMCKNENGQDITSKFIEINMGFPVVKEINGKNPAPTGSITINKTDIHGYKGNKILVYGDNFSFKDKWQTHVGTSLGATFFKLGDGTDPLCSVGTDTTNVPLCSVRKLENLTRSIQDNNIDTVLVMAGFNDFDYDGTIKPSNQGVISLKNPNDEYSSTTISGAMATVIKHMMLNHKDVRLFVCTFPNIKHQGNSTQDNQLEYKNSANISVAEINKTIKETAEFYGVPCIDVCGLSGIGKLNRSGYLENATTLNEEGNKAVANVVVNELLRFNKNI